MHRPARPGRGGCRALAGKDTGDGFILSIDPNVPRSLLLALVPTGLRAHLLAYNQDRPGRERFRVRLAVHAGDVLGDPDPFVGEATNHVCRLLDSDALHACLQATPQPVVVIASEAIYRGVVSRAHGGLDPAVWHRVVVHGKEGQADAWVHVPADEELAIHLCALQGVAPGALRSDLEAQPANLDLAIRQALIGRPSAVEMLLVVDQFEEVFTLCGDERERAGFLDALLGAVNSPRSRARIVLGVRADFYARCGANPALVAALQDAQVLIGPMTEGELRAVIAEPAARAGMTVEAALVEAALGGARDEPGALPLLSHALLTTWQRRKGRRLALADYLAAGGVQGAVSKTAEEIYGELDPAQRQIAKGIFLRLTVIDEGMQDTKRRTSLDELWAGGDATATAAVLERLAAARLVTLGKDSAEVTHEALIRSWPRLREWLTDDREWLRVHQRLMHAAQEWDALGREPDALYRGARLAETQTWAGDPRHERDLTALERAFLATSLRLEAEEQHGAHQRTRRLHQLVAALASLLALTLVAGGFALQRTQEAIRQRNFTVAGQLVAVADKLREDGDPVLAAQFYVAALHFAETPDTRSRVLSAVAGPNAGRLLGHTDTVYRASFSPDGRVLATASFDGTARLWDVTGRSALRVLAAGHPGSVLAVAFSPPAGHLVATGGRDGTVRLWDGATGTRLTSFTGHVDGVRDVAFSPDGRTLATAGSDRTARLWDVHGAPPVATPAETLRGFRGPVLALAFSPDGRTVATASADRTVRLWDATRGTQLNVLRGHTGAVNGVAFSPDGRTVATASADRTVRLWDAARGVLLEALAHVGRVFGVAFSRDGLLATTGDEGTVLLWSIRGSPLQGHAGPVRSVAFSPDSRLLATTGNDETVRLWDVARRTQLAVLTGHSGIVPSVRFSPDGRLLATASNDETVRLWDVARRTQMAVLTG